MERMNMDAMNMMDRMVNMGMANPMRRMEGELGKLISSVKDDEKSFQVMVDVSQFRPNEVTVKATDKNIVVHGRHEERTDQHGYVSREFRRRVAIPKGVNPESVTSTLSPEGVLTVMAPKLTLQGSERVIPITMAHSAGVAGSIGQKASQTPAKEAKEASE